KGTSKKLRLTERNAGDTTALPGWAAASWRTKPSALLNWSPWCDPGDCYRKGKADATSRGSAPTTLSLPISRSVRSRHAGNVRRTVAREGFALERGARHR